jgi:hypothetical protein
MAASLRLGEDIRFVLVAVGGGAVRIGREVIHRKLRYLESVAINCDIHVQEAEEFDRRIFLGPEAGGEGDTGGSPLVGGILARAAQPVLDRIFEQATFVTVIGTLGGGSGTGALPPVIDAAARSSAVLSVFVVRPFLLEHERRSVADRALGRLHFLDRFIEKQQRHQATLQVLDNETLYHRAPRLPFNAVNRRWADVVAHHIQTTFIQPAETMFAAARHAVAAESEPMNTPTPIVPPVELPSREPPPLPPSPAPLAPALLAEPSGFDRTDAELTFEILPHGLSEFR